MAVGRRRAGRRWPAWHATCREGQLHGVGREWAPAQSSPGRNRAAPQSTTRRVRARAFARVLGQAARAAAAHVLTAASFIPSPALAERTLSGRGDFILTLVNLLSVFITRRLADHALAMRRTSTRPIGRPLVQGANLFPLEWFPKSSAKTPVRRDGVGVHQGLTLFEEVADRSFEASVVPDADRVGRIFQPILHRHRRRQACRAARTSISLCASATSRPEWAMRSFNAT